MIQKFYDFITEKNTYKETGVNRNIIDLSEYILSDMKNNNKRSELYIINDLKSKFSFLNDWKYSSIKIQIKQDGSNMISYLPFSNSIIIFLKHYSKSILNHELFHAFQSASNPKNLLTSYENKTLLNQLSPFFIKNIKNIDLLKKLIYYSDNMEMGAYIHSFKKMDENEKVEILTYILLLKYFNLNKLISNKELSSKFIFLWKKYYGNTIPFIDRIYSIRNNIINSDIKINKKDLKPFIDKINNKFNDAGENYIIKITNQYTNIDELDTLSTLLNKASHNIYRNILYNKFKIPNELNFNIEDNISIDIE